MVTCGYLYHPSRASVANVTAPARYHRLSSARARTLVIGARGLKAEFFELSFEARIRYARFSTSWMRCRDSATRQRRATLMSAVQNAQDHHVTKRYHRAIFRISQTFFPGQAYTQGSSGTPRVEEALRRRTRVCSR